MTKRTIKKELADRRAAAIVAVTTSFALPFSGAALTVAVPIIGIEFNSSATSLGWIVSAFFISATVFAIPFGKIGDIWGRRRIMFSGLLIFAVFSAAIIFSNSLEMLIVFRILQGLGAGMINATNIAILIEIFPEQMRGRALGMSVSATYLGVSLGPVIGGLVTHHLGWRSVAILFTIILIFAFIVAVWRLPKTAGLVKEEELDKTVNLISILLYMLAIAVLMYGFTTFGQTVWSYILFVAGIILLVVFIIREDKVSNPIVEIRLWKTNINYLLSNCAALLNYSATYAVGYLVSIYLQMVKGYSADITGIILITQALTQSICSPFAGRLSDKKSPYTIATIGMSLCVVSLFTFTFISENTSTVFVIASLVIIGVGTAFFASPNTNAIMSCVEPSDYGMASSIVSTMRHLGQLSSMAIITIIFHFSIGNTPIADATKTSLSSSMKIIFVVFVLLCLIGVFISTQRKAPNRRPSEKN